MPADGTANLAKSFIRSAIAHELSVSENTRKIKVAGGKLDRSDRPRNWRHV
jgi:hypothetical protein